jgi:phage-related protein
MYPIIELKTTINNNSIRIINKSDNNRAFEFTGLQGGETLFVDNQKKIIRSSTGLNRLSNFNKKFFRLHRGVNELQIIGTCEYIKITYQNVKRLGGAVY